VITVRPSPGKGRGVFATQRIPAGRLIEEAPVIAVPNREIAYLDNITLQDYYFLWGPDQQDAAVALGACSLCNHSFDPNCQYIRRPEVETICFVALRDIEPGEEVTINYNGDPGADRPLWFDVLP
jgi:SET domain-containing protein